MCRNIRTLYNFEPAVTEEEIHAASLQFVRKISGFDKPSRVNEAAFHEAVDDIARISGGFSPRSNPARRRRTERKRRRARRHGPRGDSAAEYGVVHRHARADAFWRRPGAWQRDATSSRAALRVPDAPNERVRSRFLDGVGTSRRVAYRCDIHSSHTAGAYAARATPVASPGRSRRQAGKVL